MLQSKMAEEAHHQRIWNAETDVVRILSAYDGEVVKHISALAKRGGPPAAK
jgi:hypothetical protein